MTKIFDEILYSERVNNEVFYQTKPYTLADFYSGMDTLEIPSYQRPYSWGRNHVEALLNDVSKISFNAGESWFLGTLFLLRTAGAAQRGLLLDGQQRTTTIQLLTLALVEAVEIIKSPNGTRDNDILKRRLTNLVANSSSEPKFLPDSTIHDAYSHLVKEWIFLKSPDDFNKTIKLFGRTCKQVYLQTGFLTSKVILENFKSIRDWVRINLTDWDKLEEFSKALLDRCWLIQIPLQNDLNTVRIFEALNNRGKQLSLVDKLRFRTLIVEGLSSTELEQVKIVWGEIFKLFSRLETSRIIKNEDDFFRVYFNIDGAGRDSEEEFFEYFDDNFASVSGVQVFLEQVTGLLRVFVAIEYPTESRNYILDFITNRANKQDYSALLVLARSLILSSSNSRFLIAKSYILLHPTANWFIEFEKCIWFIIRNVFWFEIGGRIKSNEVRTTYLAYCLNASIGDFYNALKINITHPLTKVENYLFQEGSNQDHARFLLQLYAFQADRNSLTVFTHKELSQSQVEHAIPRAWKSHWSTSGPKHKKDVVDFYESSKSKYSSLDLERFCSFIKQDDVPLVFVNYDTNPFTKEKQIIEMIGNRFVLSKRLNQAASNLAWDGKKIEYQRVGHRIPSDNDDFGVLAYDAFTWQDACTRSLGFIDKVFALMSEKANLQLTPRTTSTGNT